MRKRNKGFTLAELLIVVAIIGVLVAISIPIFSKLVDKAKFATNVANARAAYAAVEAEFLTNDYHPGGTETYYSYDTETGKVKAGADTGGYEGVGLRQDAPDFSYPLSSWTTSTCPGDHSDWALGKRLYKKWILVVDKTNGKVRQYLVYTK
ncbi:MAG: prepilin-type N-terminal cleavage/methylation domain-containing protein [Bilifractor sp.]|jgi:prepilin-type N-terminal cleavage/methylation domain-containing protein|nr:prepilin-type N-terminal cleavage/methylation domain-containing protein [Bilifractor sp.]